MLQQRYTYTVSTFDAAGNESTQSSPASATTLDFGSTINTITVGDMDGNGQDDLILDFGHPYGMYVKYNDTSWMKLHTSSPEIMDTGDLDGNGKDDVIMGFDDPWGLYVRYDDSRWAKIHKSSPEIMVTGDMDGNGQDDLIVNFGSDSVIWMRMNNSTWNAD